MGHGGFRKCRVAAVSQFFAAAPSLALFKQALKANGMLCFMRLKKGKNLFIKNYTFDFHA